MLADERPAGNAHPKPELTVLDEQLQGRNEGRRVSWFHKKASYTVSNSIYRSSDAGCHDGHAHRLGI